MSPISVSKFGQKWSTATRYALAVVIFFIALGIGWSLFPVDGGLVYLIFWSAMVICLYLCGTGPGILMALLLAASRFYASLPPYFTFVKPSSSDFAIAAFLVSAGLTAYVFHRMQAALRLAGEKKEWLRQSEDWYKTILQDQSELISRFRPDGTLTFVNDAFCKYFGKTSAELIGSKWNPIAHPDDLTVIKERLSRLSPSHPIIEIENRVVAADGSTRWCRFTNRAFFDANGNLVESQAVGRDTTKQHEAQDLLRQANERFESLARHIPVGIYKLRSNHTGELRFFYASERLAELLDTTVDAILADPEAAFAKTHPEDRAALDDAIYLAVRTVTPFAWEGRGVVHGETRWYRIESNPTILPSGECVWDGILLDITTQKILDEQVRNFAYHDSLTGLPNRRLLYDRTCQLLAASKRSGTLGALLYLDLDNFKPLNDEHGHEAGDHLLIEVARRLTNCVRAVDSVARVGGDEFVVLLGGLTGSRNQATAEALAVTEKMRKAVAEPFLLSIKTTDGCVSEITHHCYASIGVATFPTKEYSCDDILKFADIAMYQAKEEGRNRVHLFVSDQQGCE